jgi:cell division control protein 45
MLNMGGMMDLTSEGWFGGFPEKLRVHVIDSSRPQTLANFFAAGDMAERVVMWDDGGVEKLEEQRTAWEGLTVSSSCYIPQDRPNNAIVRAGCRFR